MATFLPQDDVLLGLQLKERWESAGNGTVFVKTGLTWFLQTQHKEGVQKEPANLQIPVRLPREGIERIVLEERRAGKLRASFNVEPILRLDALKQAQRELGIAE